MLVLIIYVFAIIFTATVNDYRTSRIGQPMSRVLLEYYGSLPRTVFTLFKSVIGGVDWETVVNPLFDVSFICVILFLCYVSFVSIAVMNVVQGLFLQSALEQAQTDQDHVIQLRLKEKQQFVDRLHELFERLDSSKDGSISLCEFETHLKDEHMQAFLQTFEIENTDAWTLFKLLDADGGGAVDMNEFVEGCIRLKGTAKSVQVAQLAYHHKWIMEKLADVSESVNKLHKEVFFMSNPHLSRKSSAGNVGLGNVIKKSIIQGPQKARASTNPAKEAAGDYTSGS